MAPESSLTVLKEPNRVGGGETAANVFSAYEQEIGPLTQFIAEDLQDLQAEHTEQWVIAAIRAASVAGKRSLGYAKAILKRWAVDGYGSEYKPPDGQRGPRRQKQKSESWEEALKKYK